MLHLFHQDELTLIQNQHLQVWKLFLFDDKILFCHTDQNIYILKFQTFVIKSKVLPN